MGLLGPGHNGEEHFLRIFAFAPDTTVGIEGPDAFTVE